MGNAVLDSGLIAGAAKVRLDERGRIAAPKNLREFLRAPSVLTGHPHGCLSVYSAERFAEIREQFQSHSNLGYLDSHLEEIVLGCAEILQLDAADRFLISGHLRDSAGIDRDARLFRLTDSIRIWSEERWKQRNELMTARLQDEGFSSTWKELRL